MYRLVGEGFDNRLITRDRLEAIPKVHDIVSILAHIWWDGLYTQGTSWNTFKRTRERGTW
jgi:hypothetical protein